MGQKKINLLSSQTITSDDNEEVLAGASTTLSLLSPPINNLASKNLSQSSVNMKCYYHHKHHHFLDYFNDPISIDALIYTSDTPLQYDEREGRSMELIGNQTNIVFVASKRVHKFLWAKEVVHLICQVI